MPLFHKKIQAGTELLREAGNIIDTTITNQEERGILKNTFTQFFTSLDKEIEDQITERAKADNNGSWLTRNIRPLSLFILVLGFIFSDFLGLSEQKTQVLAEWGSSAILFYFGARTVEKAIPMITNFTKSLRRKG